MRMNDAQEAHLARVKDTFDLMVEAKYRAGANEHGNTLMDMTARQLICEAIDETVDLFVYLTRAKEIMERGQVDER